MSHGNATKRFVTATSDTPLIELLNKRLPSQDNLVAITSGGAWIDRKRIQNPHHNVKARQTVIVYYSPIQHMSFELTEDMIVYENDDFLVIDKPAKITSAADRSSLYYNITYAVQTYFKSQGSSYVPSPISRLDYMVTGLMLFAKHKKEEKRLFMASMNRTIGKLYEAQLLFDPNKTYPKCLRINDSLNFTNKCYLSKNGKKSESLFMNHSRTDSSVTYRVILLTGRRHQIRFHASHYLSPIIGDDLYGDASKDDTIKLRCISLNIPYKHKKTRIRIT